MTERAYRYRFYPTVQQENLLRRTMGCVRLVYNKALAIKTKGSSNRHKARLKVAKIHAKIKDARTDFLP